jgi:heme exporter protein C
MLGWLSLAGFAVLGILIFGFTPPDKYMGFSQKIMYIHLPTVLGAYVAFFVVFFCSIGYLWKRTEAYDRVAKSSAEIGVIFSALVLVTGSIWGRPTWGTYWVWDARLTTSLVLFLIYVGYVLLRTFAGPGERQARLAAVMGIIGFLDIPLIHVSVQWWRTLHQESSMFRVDETGAAKPSMPPELLIPLLLSLAMVLIFYGYLMLYRIRVDLRDEALQKQLAKG